MTCNEIKELTVPYLELDMEPSRVRDVTTHLNGCAGCRAEMEAVRQVLVRVKGMAVPDPGDRFWKEFPEKVRRGLARERPTGRSVWNATWMPSWPLALAASLLLVVGVWLLRGQFDEAPAPSLRTAAKTESVRPASPDFTTADLPSVVDADWPDYWEVDPDAALVEMARQLDRQTLDRLFTDI